MSWRKTSMDESVLRNIVWGYQNRNLLQAFCGDNLIFKNFNKLSLVKLLFNQNAGINVLEHYQTLSDLFMRVLWDSCNKNLKNIQKSILTGGFFYKNCTTDTFLEGITKEKIFKKTLCKPTPFSLILKVCSPEIPTSTKTVFEKNVSRKRFEIARKLALKRSVMKLFIKVAGLLSRTCTLLKKALHTFLAGYSKVKHY